MGLRDLVDLIFSLKQPEAPHIAEDTTPKWERSLQHAKYSYDNVQAVIRFIDTKTSMLVAISAVVTAGVASAPFWLESLNKDARAHLFVTVTKYPCLGSGLVVLWATALATGICAIINALLSTIARQPNHIEPFSHSAEVDPEGLPHRVILFPLVCKRDLKEMAAVLTSLRKGMDYPQILKEYEKQLLVTGAILNNKIQHNRRAVIWLMRHIIIAALMVVLFAIVSIL